MQHMYQNKQSFIISHLLSINSFSNTYTFTLRQSFAFFSRYFLISDACMRLFGGNRPVLKVFLFWVRHLLRYCYKNTAAPMVRKQSLYNRCNTLTSAVVRNG